MSVEESIKKAWEATVTDYKHALSNHFAKLWTEHTLRLNFIRRLSENAELDRILAETPYPVGKEEYKPDMILDISDNEDIERIVFELKFFGSMSEWLRDLEKLRKYSLIGWNKGYFCAIGSNWQCEEIRKAPPYEKHKINPDYEVHVLASPAEFSHICDIAFYRDLMKMLFEKKERSIVINESSLWALAYFEKYSIIISGSIKQGKLVVYAQFFDEISEDKLKELDYQWFTLDENDEMQPTLTFKNLLLINEIDISKQITYAKEVAQLLKQPIIKFREKMKLVFES